MSYNRPRGHGSASSFRNNRAINNNNNNNISNVSPDPNHKEPSRCVIVHNLNRQTLPDTILDYFLRFERVDKVTLNTDDNETPTGSATVQFSQIPRDLSRLIGKHTIDGRSVQVEFTKDTTEPYNNTNRRVYETSRFFARSLSLGTMIAPKKYVEEWQTTLGVKYVLKYTQRRVEIFFTHLNNDYKMEYKFKDVFGDMHVERDDRNTTILTIRLRYPPTYWKRNYKSRTSSKLTATLGNSWERVILIPLKEGEIDTKPKPLMPIPHPEAVNIAQWRVLRLVFQPAQRHLPQFERNLKEAADFNLVPRDLSRLKPFIEVVKPSDLPKPLGHVERVNLNLAFDVLYMLEANLSYDYLNTYNLTDQFYSQLQRLDPDISCGLLRTIYVLKQHVYDPVLQFSRIFDKLGMKVKAQGNIPSHCALLRKVIITPSHFYLQPPSLETTNRVVRHYREYADRFIRVQFMDEGFNRVGPSRVDRQYKEVIYQRIYHVLKKGIQIGNRRYEFLAFSSSQLREQGCWFFAPTATLTADMIRDWMGVFSHEKVVAKHAVRIGQCFSSTRPVCVLQENEVAYIEDIKRNGFTFSDGVGKISPALAEEVAVQMDLRTVPSAFQFRLGGAKGVLTVDKSLGEGPIKVQLRPSQIKFESKHLTLEVIRTSTFINGYLNRQVITLLSSLGVKDKVFMDLMDNMLEDINKMFETPSEAVRVLQSNVDTVGTVVSMVSIIQAGFLERRDPYITNLLSLFRINVLKDLKKKAKIIVPKGAYLLGVMDETGTLEEGEVFVQIYNNTFNNAHKEIITGEVVVFRNPCFHPGDVRVVQAVDRPNLHHLIDVVVFSSKGFRDIPSMCSGGDLDGDDYTVYWDKNLIPEKKNFTPMDYTAAPPKLVQDVKIRDIIKFFVNYINYDNLGQIANAHLATADQSANGARDGKCILLAQLHSEAVDFPKSGKPAQLTDDLIVKAFPDFMQKKDKETYESKKVLGKIFRSIDKSKYKDYQSSLTEEAVYDPRLNVPGMEYYIKEARELRTLYNRDLSALMNQFGVQTETEICSGYIIKWLKKGKSKTRFEQHDATMKQVQAFKLSWKRQFEKEFLDSSKKLDLSQRAKIEAKAAAWYYVAYHPVERKRDSSIEGGFFSFPWCIYEYICEIAKRNTHKKLDDSALSAAFDEEVIIEGNRKLQLERGNSSLVYDDDDDDDDDDDEEEEYDSYSSDDEIITYNAPGNVGRGPAVAAASAAAAAAAATSNDNTLVNTSADIVPTSYHSLEPHQSIVGADATMDDLARILL